VGKAQEFGASGVVVEVGVADEQDLHVAQMEAELGNTPLNKRRRHGEAGVDEDVALRRDDEVGGEVLAADVVEVVGDAEGRDGGGPLRVRGAVGLCARQLREQHHCKADADARMSLRHFVLLKLSSASVSEQRRGWRLRLL